ncbi:MAG: LptF/LptG family permease [Candidatus Eisenbacteria bacterium]
MRILRLYVLRLHLVPWLLGFGVVTYLLQLDFLVDIMDLLVARGIPLRAVGELFVLSLAWMVALSVPCGVLVASLMTFGRMAQDNEITALKTSGINMFRILLAPLAAAFVLFLALCAFNAWILPESNHRLASLMVDVSQKRPTVRLAEGVFINDFPGYSLLVRRVVGTSNEMRGITLFEFGSNPSPTIIVAEHGTLTYMPDGETAMLELHDGVLHEVPGDTPGARKYRQMKFDVHRIYVPGAGTMLRRSVRDMRSDREMNLGQLRQEIKVADDQLRGALARAQETLDQGGIASLDLVPRADGSGQGGVLGPLGLALARMRGHTIDLANLPESIKSELQMNRLEVETLARRKASLEVELHKKFALAFACVVFVLIGAPLGMQVKRGGVAIGFVSILFFAFYYLCLQFGESFADRLLLPPWLAMWLANIVLGGWGLVATLQACEVRFGPRVRHRARTAPSIGTA